MSLEQKRACVHKRAGIVTTHPNGYPGTGAHAATDCCARPACIEWSIHWAWKKTSGMEAIYVPDSALSPAPKGNQ